MGRKAGFFRPPPKPSKASKTLHHVLVVSQAQAKRMAAGGSNEADIDALNAKVTDEDRRMRAVRHAIEDRRIARKLWIDDA